LNHNNDVNANSSLRYLLAPFFEALNYASLSYCVVGNHENLPEYTSHDVDIWTENLKLTEKLLLEVAAANGFVHYLGNKTANGSNNFFFTSPEKSFEIIRIDLMDECAWKSIIPIVTAEKIGRTRAQFKNFFVSDPTLQTAMHLLYPLLTKGRIKDKYREKIYSLRNNIDFRRVIRGAIGNGKAARLIDKVTTRDWKAIERDAHIYRRGSIYRAAFKMDIRRLWRLTRFFSTNIYRVAKPSGLFIALIGLDGCGKTTILRSLDQFFEEAFLPGKARRFYWRPFYLPRIKVLFSPRKREEPNPVIGNIAPQMVRQTPLHMIFYFFKFLYYLTDFIIGRVKYQSVWSRGGIVCFDRYYYDHLLYPQRFGFIMPQIFMKMFLRLVPKPDIVFYLDAPPKVLFHRKQELSMDELKRQRWKYETLIAELPNAIKIDTTSSLQETLDTITKSCMATMSERVRAN
jgi:thymidylate kinase